MSLISQINTLTTRIGTEFKAAYAKIGTLSSLTTTTKTDLVSAINEVKASVPAAGPGIDDTTPSSSKVYSSSKTNSAISAAVAQAKTDIIGGAPAALDALNELSAALGNDPNYAATTATALGSRLRVDLNTQGLTTVQQANGRTNLSVYSQAEVGDPTTDFVATFTASLT